MSLFRNAAFAAAVSVAVLGGTALTSSFTPAFAEMTVEVGGAPMYPSKNIIENAVNSKDHTTLVAAVKAAQLTFWFDGGVLPRKYGFPMKLRIPTKLGFKNPKHIDEIEIGDDFNGGYWETYGYNWFSGL